MKLKTEVLPTKSFKLLKKIMNIEDFNDFYLAGGTALALQLGHRISVDLDFFSSNPFSVSLISSFPETYTTNYVRKNSMQIVSKETKVEFIYWAFPITQKVKVINNIKLIDPIDIGLMKLLAIQGRITKKDIVDLYIIDKEIIELKDLITLFENHYPKESFNLYQSLKDLFNSEKIQNDPLPNMLTECNFKEIFGFMKGLVIGIVKNDFIN